MNEVESKPNLWHVLAVYVSWLLITEFVPDLFRLAGLSGRVNLWLLSALRMAFLLLAAWAYVAWYERKTFSSGFNIRLEKLGKNLLWAVVFALLAMAVLAAYQFLLVNRILDRTVEASAAPVSEAVKPFGERILEYLYVVFEGIVEVLIFIGFLVDRLVKRWNRTAAVIVGNIGFALWHYSYWQKGALEGSLMIFLTFLVGTVVSLNYLKTRNCFSSVICHTLVDTPTAIRELLGMMG